MNASAATVAHRALHGTAVDPAPPVQPHVRRGRDARRRARSVRRLPDRAEAERLDADLRGIARSETGERLALGHLAKVFLVRQSHHDLGFARIGDYTRERLGISTSQFYELAQVATSLSSLPLIEGALARGDISWTKARELAAVAAPDTQGQWLGVASQHTADQLHTLVSSCRGKAAASVPDNGRGEERFGYANADDHEIDDEEAATVVIRCPQSVRLLWWDVLRLSCRVAGSDLAVWQSAEFIAAEGLSETGWPSMSSRSPWTRVRYPHPRTDGAGTEPATTVLPKPCEPAARAERDHVARMSARVEAVTAEQLDHRMREMIAKIQRIDADMGMLLCRLADNRLHRRLGFGDFGTYCRNTLGLSERRAHMLVAIERVRRRTCSRLTVAYRSGELSSHRCVVLLPVLTEQTADAWIDRAQRVTARRLADEVMWSRMACDAGLQPGLMPPRLGSRLENEFRSFVQFRGSSAGVDERATAFGSALLDVEIRFRAPGTVAELFRWAVFARRQAHEPVWVGLLRLLEHVRAFWLAAPRHRDPVFERDGWRCAVPGCSSRRNLHDHHVVFKSHGGSNERDNRVAVCAAHHQHCIHTGMVRARGKASVGLDWELGRRRAGEPLLCVSGRGESYVQMRSDSEPLDWARFVPLHAGGGHESCRLRAPVNERPFGLSHVDAT